MVWLTVEKLAERLSVFNELFGRVVFHKLKEDEAVAPGLANAFDKCFPLIGGGCEWVAFLPASSRSPGGTWTSLPHSMPSSRALVANSMMASTLSERKVMEHRPVYNIVVHWV